MRALAKHYRKAPDVLDGPRIQAYLLHLITERKLVYASVNQASCAFRFLSGTVLRKPEMRLDIASSLPRWTAQTKLRRN